MQLHEVAEVTQVLGAGNANSKLQEGWKLIGVTGASLNNGSASVMYVLGRAEAQPKPKDDPLAGLTSADIARANQGL